MEGMFQTKGLKSSSYKIKGMVGRRTPLLCLIFLGLILEFSAIGTSVPVIDGLPIVYLQEFYYFTVGNMTRVLADTECDVWSEVDGSVVFAVMDHPTITTEGIEERQNYLIIQQNNTKGAGRFFFSDQYFIPANYTLHVMCPNEVEINQTVTVASGFYRPLTPRYMGLSGGLVYGNLNVILASLFLVTFGLIVYSAFRWGAK
jgi:hypothetical protein